jgi:hypothetical protein
MAVEHLAKSGKEEQVAVLLARDPAARASLGKTVRRRPAAGSLAEGVWKSRTGTNNLRSAAVSDLASDGRSSSALGAEFQ